MFVSGLFPHGRAVLRVVFPLAISWVIPWKTSARIALDPEEWIFLESQTGLDWNRPKLFPFHLSRWGHLPLSQVAGAGIY